MEVPSPGTAVRGSLVVVQNAAAQRELDVVTSAAAFGSQLGQVIGVAAFGALFRRRAVLGEAKCWLLRLSVTSV